jgi:hypothetical protein
MNWRKGPLIGGKPQDYWQYLGSALVGFDAHASKGRLRPK